METKPWKTESYVAAADRLSEAFLLFYAATTTVSTTSACPHLSVEVVWRKEKPISWKLAEEREIGAKSWELETRLSAKIWVSTAGFVLDRCSIYLPANFPFIGEHNIYYIARLYFEEIDLLK